MLVLVRVRFRTAGRALSGGLGPVNSGLPLLQFHVGWGNVSLHLRVKLVEHRFQFWIGGDGLAPDPRLRRARAVGEREDADGHV